MMKAIRRITTGLFANFDWAVTQIENHEALVNAAVREIQHASAKAKVQLARVRQDGERIRQRLASQRDADVLWTDRALRCAALDQPKALECLRRKKRVQAEIAELELQLNNHERLEVDLARDLETIERRMEDLKRKRNEMRTRESTAEALAAFQSQDAGLIAELDDVFDRWEVKVGSYETLSSAPLSADRKLDQEFESAEEEAELRAELEGLLAAKQAPIS